MTDTPLSDDAKALFGSQFGMAKIGADALTFRMNDTRPTARAQAALDELEAAGMVAQHPYNSFGGAVYSPLVSAVPYRNWYARFVDTRPDLAFPITEKVNGFPETRKAI